MHRTTVIAACLVSILTYGCSSRTWTRVGEVVKRSTVAGAGAYLCKKAETDYKVTDGRFTVPPGGCTHRQLPSGDLLLSMSGTGHYEKHRVISGDFTSTITVEYTVCLNGGYAYLVPANTYVAPPTLSEQSLGSALLERFFGSVSREIHNSVNAEISAPRTVIPRLQGRMCVVKGWIPPGTIPRRCEGDKPGEKFEPAGGYQEPAEADWGSVCGQGGANVTAGFAPAENGPAPWSTRAETEVRRVLDENGPSIAAAVQGVTHPTGKEARISGFTVDSRPGGVAIAQIAVEWRGGIIGRSYTTMVTWKFRKSKHLSAQVTSDTALGRAAERTSSTRISETRCTRCWT